MHLALSRLSTCILLRLRMSCPPTSRKYRLIQSSTLSDASYTVWYFLYKVRRIAETSFLAFCCPCCGWKYASFIILTISYHSFTRMYSICFLMHMHTLNSSSSIYCRFIRYLEHVKERNTGGCNSS